MFGDGMAPPRAAVAVDDEEILAATGCANPSFAFPRPFRMLASTDETTTTTVDRGRLMGEWTKARVQLCGRFAVDIDGSRIEDTLPGRRGRVAVRLPGPQPRPCGAPRRAAHGRLGRGGSHRGGKRAERAAVQAAARPGRRPAPGSHGDRAAAAAGDLRRRRGGPGGRPPGRVRHRRGAVGAGLGPGRDRLPRRHQAIPHRAGGALDRSVAAPPGGGPAPRAGVLCRRRPRPRWSGAGPSRGAGQDADRARAIPRDRAPHPAWKRSSGAAMSPRRCAPTIGYESCSERSSGSRPAPPSRLSTGGCCRSAEG